MSKPVVAIVGRPNVGKSTFFNKVVGKRIAIVEDTPGVTRDRLYFEVEWCGRKMMMIDTGGIEPATNDMIMTHIKNQAQIAIDHADVYKSRCDGRRQRDSCNAEKVRKACCTVCEQGRLGRCTSA